MPLASTERKLLTDAIVRDDGGKDAFIHASVLERSGVATLNEGQRVLIDIAEGRKGPEAVRVRLA
jgi:CspA family cold shock protein